MIRIYDFRNGTPDSQNFLSGIAYDVDTETIIKLSFDDFRTETFQNGKRDYDRYEDTISISFSDDRFTPCDDLQALENILTSLQVKY